MERYGDIVNKYCIPSNKIYTIHSSLKRKKHILFRFPRGIIWKKRHFTPLFCRKKQLHSCKLDSWESDGIWRSWIDKKSKHWRVIIESVVHVHRQTHCTHSSILRNKEIREYFTLERKHREQKQFLKNICCSLTSGIFEKSKLQIDLLIHSGVLLHQKKMKPTGNINMISIQSYSSLRKYEVPVIWVWPLFQNTRDCSADLDKTVCCCFCLRFGMTY